MQASDRDVVVIGAGIAGLAVAHEIVQAGNSVLVLEARDRVGGRLLAHDVDGVGLDLGATWYWPGERRVAQLIDALGVQVHPSHISGDAMYHDAPAQRLSGNPIDVPSGRFSDGAASLPQAVAKQLPDGALQLGATVRSITTSDTGATVAYDSGGGNDHDYGTVRAQHVVLALPPALAAHAITIEPPLPQPLSGLVAITPVWMGAIAKVVAVYDTAFWRQNGLAGSAISHVGPMREIHDMSGPDGTPAALFGFVPLSQGNKPPTRDEVQAQLVEIFGPQAASPLEIVIHDWSAEEFTSPPNVAELGAYQAYGHPLFQEPCGHGRLHWASTETATVAPGHIEGALAAAERTAAAIMADLALAPTH